MSALKALLHELRRRKVLTTAAGYVVLAWLILQVADVLFPIYELPDFALRGLTTALFIGFPAVLVLSWFFDFNLSGATRTRDENTAGDRVDPVPATPVTGLPGGPSIAVLPFTSLGHDTEQEAFAAALGNDIVTGLTQSSHLQVLAAGSTEVPTEPDGRLSAIGRQLGAEYLLYGSVRTSGDALRVSVHLVESRSALELWSENYDRSLTADALFQLQDDIRERIVATLGDLHGVIYSNRGKRIKHRPTTELEAYECLAVALTYDKYISEENHLLARECLERAIEIDPQYDEAWAHLSWIYMDEWVWGFNPLPESRSRALAAALKSIELAPDNYHNHWLLSRVHYFNGDLDAFRASARRALELNDRDGTTLGLIGLYTAWSGDWHAGLAMLDKARQLNPNYPPYYHMPYGTHAFARGEYAEALEHFSRTNLPDWSLVRIMLAATYSRLGQEDQALRQSAGLGPLRSREAVKEYLSRSLPFQERLVEEISELPIWADTAPGQ